MTVAELIKCLSAFPDDREVEILFAGDAEGTPIGKIVSDDFDGATVFVVAIE